MGAIEQFKPLAIATVLDQRFKKMHFTDPIASVNTIQKIKEMVKSSIPNKTVNGIRFR